MSDEVKATLKQLGIDEHIDLESPTFKALLSQANRLAPTIQAHLLNASTDDKGGAIASAMSGSEFNVAALAVLRQSPESSTKVAIAGCIAKDCNDRSA